MKHSYQRNIYIFIACFFAVWTVRATFLYSIDESISSDLFRTVYSTFIKTTIWVGSAFWFARWIRQSNPLKYLSLSVFPSLKNWGSCLIVITLYFGAVLSFETLWGGKSLDLTNLSSMLTLGGILFFIVSPLVEEVLFRGLFLKELSAFLPKAGANILTSLLFVGIHLPFWLSHGGITEALLVNCAGVFIFSLIAGWLYQKSASVWPSVLAHVANNLIATCLI